MSLIKGSQWSHKAKTDAYQISVKCYSHRTVSLCNFMNKLLSVFTAKQSWYLPPDRRTQGAGLDLLIWNSSVWKAFNFGKITSAETHFSWNTSTKMLHFCLFSKSLTLCEEPKLCIHLTDITLFTFIHLPETFFPCNLHFVCVCVCVCDFGNASKMLYQL